MEQMTLIIIAVSIILFVPVSALMIWYWNSFKYVAKIARQTGKDMTNVVWTSEKFKVKYEDGIYVINFRFLQQRTPTQNNRLWTQFLKSGLEKRSLKIPKEEWETKNFKAKVQTGLHLFETEKGALLPMEINYEGDKATFRVLNQDQRYFEIKSIRDANSLTRDKKRELIAVVVLVVGMIVFGVMFVFGIIYMTDHAQKTVAMQTTACADIIRSLTMNNTGTNGQTGFINQLTQGTVGG